jgi:hypothetical protein
VRSGVLCADADPILCGVGGHRRYWWDQLIPAVRSNIDRSAAAEGVYLEALSRAMEKLRFIVPKGRTGLMQPTSMAQSHDDLICPRSPPLLTKPRQVAYASDVPHVAFAHGGDNTCSSKLAKGDLWHASSYLLDI